MCCFKSFNSEKKESKNKKKYRIVTHALVEKMLIKFIAVFIGKVLLDARWWR